MNIANVEESPSARRGMVSPGLDGLLLWVRFSRTIDWLQGRLDSELIRATNMPFAYYGILTVLNAAPGQALRMSELALACGGSRSRLSHAVNRIEEQGWVTRDRALADGRGAVARLTPHGRKALENATSMGTRLVENLIFSRISQDQAVTLEQISAVLFDDPTRC